MRIGHLRLRKILAWKKVMIKFAFITTFFAINSCIRNRDYIGVRHNMPNVLLNIDTIQGTYTITIVNESLKTILIYDNISKTSESSFAQFGPGQVRIRNSPNVMGLPVASDWWTFGMLYSRELKLPVKLKPLIAGSTITGKYSLASLMRGNLQWKQPYSPSNEWNKNKEIQLRYTLYYDSPQLKQSTDYYTNWLPLSRSAEN